MKNINVLVACEESQAVCKAFRQRGFNAFSADIQECSGGYPEFHILGDVLKVLEPINGVIQFWTESGDFHIINKWNLVIAFPPCTYLSKAGSCSLFNKDHTIKDFTRYNNGVKAKEFFMQFYNCSCPHVAIENPTPIRIFNLPPCQDVLHPCDFGHPYTKRTCLWLKGLPPLFKQSIFSEVTIASKSTWFTSYTGARKQKNRSKTFTGVAQAMAEQWGNFIKDLNF